MLIDAHTHLDMYGDKLNEALTEIQAHRILSFSNSMDLNSYNHNVEISRRCRYIIPSFGIHPWSARDNVDHLDDFIAPVFQTPMLGEIGLDYYWAENKEGYTAQQKVFEFFLAAAREHNKAVNLHTKGAEKEILDFIVQYGLTRVIIHWYSGPLDIFNKLIDRGCFFTFGCEVAYSEEIRELARRIPLELLLTETDNPGGLQWLSGEIGMPALVIDVLQNLAGLRNRSFEDLAWIVEGNLLRFVQSDPWLPEVYSEAIQGTFGA